jgi:hypothetical protein
VGLVFVEPVWNALAAAPTWPLGLTDHSKCPIMRDKMCFGGGPLAMLAVVVASVSQVASLYAFGFQRLTRDVSIARTGSSGAQTLMTPWLVGLVGWLGTIGTLAGAALLWGAYGWLIGVGYYAATWVLSTVMPFGWLHDHYLALIRAELGKQMYGTGDKGVVAGLMVECLSR